MIHIVYSEKIFTSILILSYAGAELKASNYSNIALKRRQYENYILHSIYAVRATKCKIYSSSCESVSTWRECETLPTGLNFSTQCLNSGRIEKYVKGRYRES